MIDDVWLVEVAPEPLREMAREGRRWGPGATRLPILSKVKRHDRHRSSEGGREHIRRRRC